MITVDLPTAVLLVVVVTAIVYVIVRDIATNDERRDAERRNRR